MRISLTSVALMSIVTGATIAAACTEAQTPQPGAWNVNGTMSGGPMGERKTTKRVCVTQAQIDAGFEQALIDAATSDDKASQRAPKCTLKDVKREGNKSSWQANCEGPRGNIAGVGTATLEAAKADALQTLEMKAPIGTVTMKQTITAQREGACQ